MRTLSCRAIGNFADIAKDYLGGPNVITKVLIRRGDEGQRVTEDVRMEAERRCCTPGFENEEGAMSQEIQATSRSWKRQGFEFSPKVSRGNVGLLMP